MKRVLAALLCGLIVLGAALYMFVVRPLLRPSDLTTVAENALATEDLLLLGGINVKQAVFLERWFQGTLRVPAVQAVSTPAVADRSLFEHLRMAGVDARHEVDYALYAVYPAGAEATRHAVVLLGRFNPAAINAYLTRDLHAAFLSPDDAGKRSASFLSNELDGRLRTSPVAFRLLLQVAEAGDPTDDVTARWPEGRPLVELGRLEITGISPTSAGDELRLIFDPTNRTDGIDLSSGPILLARSATYAISYERRSKGE